MVGVGVVFTYHAVLTRVLNLFRLMTDFPGLVVAVARYLAEVPQSLILGSIQKFHSRQKS